MKEGNKMILKSCENKGYCVIFKAWLYVDIKECFFHVEFVDRNELKTNAYVYKNFKCACDKYEMFAKLIKSM